MNRVKLGLKLLKLTKLLYLESMVIMLTLKHFIQQFKVKMIIYNSMIKKLNFLSKTTLIRMDKPFLILSNLFNYWNHNYKMNYMINFLFLMDFKFKWIVYRIIQLVIVMELGRILWKLMSKNPMKLTILI